MTSQGLFDSLARSLRERPELQVALTAHVRALSGQNTLFAFQMSDVSEAQKIEVWKWCLGAVVNDCVPEPKVSRVREAEPQLAVKQFEGID
jgi:hypothetical protein